MAQTFLILAQVGGQSPMGTIVMMGGIFLILYFVLIRPQQKQVKEHRNLMASLKKGDEVVTQGGVLGKIHAVMDKTLALEVASGVRIVVLKSSIQGKTNLAGDAAPAKAEEKEEK